MSNMKFVAFGDSVMWGQGLNRDDKYCYLAAKEIARLNGCNFNPANDLILRAHSGAKIDETQEKREKWMRNYGFAFPNKAAWDNFYQHGKGWTGIYGEIGETFPTVRDQVNNFDDWNPNEVDVVFLTGGGNDVDFEQIINPDNGSFAEDSRLIYTTLESRMRGLIQLTRQKFPRSLIIYTGYYPLFSMNSDPKLIQDFFEWFAVIYESKGNKGSELWNTFLIGLNRILKLQGNPYTARRRIYNAFFMSAFVARNIIDGYDDPNLIYSEPSWHVNNSLWAPHIRPYAGYKSQEAMHGGYRKNDIRDAAYPRRMEEANKVLDAMGWSNYESQAVTREIMALSKENSQLAAQIASETDPNKKAALERQREEVLARLQQLVDEINDDEFRYGHSSQRAAHNFRERIDHGKIPWVSFLHPNERGARLFRDDIVRKYKAWQTVSLRATLAPLGGSLDQITGNNRNGSLALHSQRDRIGHIVLQIKADLSSHINFQNRHANWVRVTYKPHMNRQLALLPLPGSSDRICHKTAEITDQSIINHMDGYDFNHETWRSYILPVDNKTIFGMDNLFLEDIEAIQLEGAAVARTAFPLPDVVPVFKEIRLLVDNKVVHHRTADLTWHRTTAPQVYRMVI